MKLPLSLRRSVALTFLLLGMALVVGYSLLSKNYFFRGMDNVLALHMERAAQRYLETTPRELRNGPVTVLGYSVTPGWQQLPEATRALFHTPPQSGELLKIRSDRGARRHSLEFLFRYGEGDDSVFVTHVVSPDNMSAMVSRNADQSQFNLIMISLATALALTVVVWWLLRKVSRPVMQLLQWTRSLDPARLKQPPPDFSYPELNQLAGLIRDSLSSVQQSLEREHRFLRHSSHELRTPISVIRSNVELLRKLQGNPAAADQQQLIIDRLDRASLTMKHLTETLLWLGRDGIDELPASEVALDELVAQLIDEMRYLLNDKPVTVHLEREPYTILLPEVAARIVLGNLIRNAFQHCWEGEVVIRQRDAGVEISNCQEPDASQQLENGSADLGFGLGLELTEQLCRRLHWHYSNGSDGTLRRARVAFK